MSIVYKVLLKKCRRVITLITLKNDPNFEEKLIFYLKNDMRSLMSFKFSSEKSENLSFDGITLSKVCNVFWAKIIQTSCVVKNDLWFQKWHDRWIFTQVVESNIR